MKSIPLPRAALGAALVLAGGQFSRTAFAAELKVGLKEIVGGLTAPTILVPYDAKRVLIGEQMGRMQLLDPATGKLEPFGDVAGKFSTLNKGKFDERGLLDVSLHPKFAGNGKIYLHYSGPKREGAPAKWDHTAHVSEFQVRNDKLDPASERVLLRIDQPYFNHNGGRQAFGPDGLLYIAVGDGGHKNDTNKQPDDHARGPRGNAQDLTTMLGKILRIDVDRKDAGKEYAVPKDNPFVGRQGVLPEIWAYGIRNPWGFSFDRGGGHELFEAEVGQTRWEEINIIKKGGNYGWNVREGEEWFNPVKEREPLDAPYTGERFTGYTDPVAAYKNIGGFGEKEGKGKSVTGGYVYRGRALKELAGKYVFADWSAHFALPRGVLFAASRTDRANQWRLEDIKIGVEGKNNVGAFVWAFGEDSAGELYLLTNPNNGLAGQNGKIHKLVPVK